MKQRNNEFYVRLLIKWFLVFYFVEHFSYFWSLRWNRCNTMLEWFKETIESENPTCCVKWCQYRRMYICGLTCIKECNGWCNYCFQTIYLVLYAGMSNHSRYKPVFKVQPFQFYQFNQQALRKCCQAVPLLISATFLLAPSSFSPVLLFSVLH